MTIEYFIYARKSSDSEERQVLSIESQIAELQEFAQKQNLSVKKVFTESQSAKVPGRPIFNDMIAQIKRGAAQGIIAWHPDRLARNSVDGGQIVYALDTKMICDLKFPTFWFESTPQGKFMLNIAFGQSKYYVDNLSENIKRGLRQKIRRGEYPGTAPVGYINNANTRTIQIDSVKAPLVAKLFQLYATNSFTLQQAFDTCQQMGLLGKSGKRFSKSEISHILSNPIYYGLFRWSGELHQGVHEPLVSKELFDNVQGVLHERTKPRKTNKQQFAFLGLAKCPHCGCSITAERQKGHTYYRCTQKRQRCPGPYAREELLAEQVKTSLANVALPQDAFAFMMERAKSEQHDSRQNIAAKISEWQNKILALTQKLDRLLDAHLNGALEQSEYLGKKQALLNERVSAEEQVGKLNNQAMSWLEPCEQFLKAAHQAHLLAEGEDFLAQGEFLKKIGSNFLISSRRLTFDLNPPWNCLAKIPHNFASLQDPNRPQNHAGQEQKRRIISHGNHAAEKMWR